MVSSKNSSPYTSEILFKSSIEIPVIFEYSLSLFDSANTRVAHYIVAIMLITNTNKISFKFRFLLNNILNPPSIYSNLFFGGLFLWVLEQES